MLKNIHIQNFRCFEDFKADGFERINLIGGKNNSGKTCLLEGICSYTNNQALLSFATYKGFPNVFELMNVNFKEKDILISGEHKLGNEKKEKVKLEMSVIVHNETQTINEKKINTTINTQLVTNFKSYPEIELYKLIDDIDKNEKTTELIKALKCIDNRIEEIRTYKSENEIFIKLKNQKKQPISFFGDAVKLCIKYFCFVLDKTKNNGNYSILLLDEVENGLHYSVHEEFWRYVFKLCHELNVQLFATTHSLEMIKAYNKVALEFEKENVEHKAAYFEMIRHDEADKITALKHTMQDLEEELELGMDFRGENVKDKIALNQKLIDTLQSTVNTAHESLRNHNLPIPFVKDGWIWQEYSDGRIEKLEKLEPIK